MKLGLCSIAFLNLPLCEVARLAADAGLDGIEITAREPHLGCEATPSTAADIRREIRSLGLDVIAYGSYFGSQGRYSETDARKEVALAAALEAPLLRVWAATVEGSGEMAPAIEGIKSITRLAAKESITIVVERHAGTFADTPERIEALFKAISESSVGLNYQPLDFLSASAYEAQPDDARRMLPLARYVHLKNYRLPGIPNANTLPWAPLGSGAIDYRSVLAVIASSGYAGPASIEFLANDDRPAAMRLAANVAFVRTALG